MKEMRVECPALSSDFADRKGQFQVENGCGNMAPATSGTGIPEGTQNDRFDYTFQRRTLSDMRTRSCACFRAPKVENIVSWLKFY